MGVKQLIHILFLSHKINFWREIMKGNKGNSVMKSKSLIQKEAKYKPRRLTLKQKQALKLQIEAELPDMFESFSSISREIGVQKEHPLTSSGHKCCGTEHHEDSIRVSQLVIGGTRASAFVIAHKRIINDDPKFGFCDDCSKPIGKERLMAEPGARKCMKCVPK
jgi:hypothetical protein